ncbi:methylated-DNA--[protein]-cysteine S-methyltransferase [Brevibacterium luteolum]|uniref:methylated-DNA--[protein]-cysteine S-methyltransferase n=1 Tax=Brevibacterium luteolum TaxID=199591 RepID=UPI001C21F7D6|nr:methylated-DNA--[protein]-cysteine S-methyltransferase [Brevibacterium luteolum]MBU8577669.1 methylated-DNA--[protein]-cysteine S-methyltransferase [Brevibacterium luteolum]
MKDLSHLFPLDEEHMRRVRQLLDDQAGDAGLVDVGYTVIDSPIGALLLAATSRGLVRVAFDSEDHDAVLAELAEKISPRVLEADAQLAPIAAQVEEYFAGQRRDFDIPLDRRLSSGFRREVQRQLSEIPYGTTQSYSEVAAAIGQPTAVRAVGTACAQNPIPLVVPCHRVLRSDGSLGGYRGGLPAKQQLLELEAAA